MSIAVPVAGDGVALLYCAFVLLVLTSIIFGLRIGVRVWRKTWGTDDYLMSIGVVGKRFMFQDRGLMCLADYVRGNGCLVHCLHQLRRWPAGCRSAPSDDGERSESMLR